MTIKTPARIAEEAARAYLTANCIKREEGETALTTFGWNLGDHAGYEETLEKFAGHVLEVERARRSTGVEYWARDAADDGPIRAGDTVRLTGKDWAGFGMLNDVVQIDHIDNYGDAMFERDGSRFAVFLDWDIDYSVTLVKRA